MAVQNAHLNIPGLVIDVLQAALKDPEDPDWLARQLFVLSADEDDGIPVEQLLLVWNTLPDDATVKIRFRMMADGFRILITGEPV